MCGIAGLYHFANAAPVERDVLEKMNACLVHRGPDEGDMYLHGAIGLAMRRLSVIDLASGHQPMSNKSKTIWIVFNGEIYNFHELRESLIKKGRTFSTQSDTEVILQLYEEMGEACVSLLRGMFAFSIWDEPNKKLLLVRDRIGKKPLYYFQDQGRLAWASEMQALLQVPGLSRDIDVSALDLYLGLQYIPSPHSIFQSVKKLPPAHLMVFENGQAKLKKYWALPVGERSSVASFDEAKHLVREKLKEATRLRMIADVPLGAFLSGGVDSTCVVGLMSELSDRPVKTFAIGFEEEEFSELKYARSAAQFFGTDHTEFLVKAEMADVLPKLVRHYGEPFGDSSALPTYYVARETRRHVTVALTGDGGDENFAGYERYQAMMVMAKLDALPLSLRRFFGGLAAFFPTPANQHSLVRKLRRFLVDVLPQDDFHRYQHMINIFSDQQKKSLYSQSFQERLAPTSYATQYIANLFQAGQSLDEINKLLLVDFQSYLPECLMTKMDIATMANSLEARSPLLDHELMELVFKMPGHYKFAGPGKSKWLLKEACRDLLPPDIQKRGKMGFGIPLGKWFRGRLKTYWRDVVMSQQALARDYFQPQYLTRIFEEHQSGKFDHGYRMWTLLMLELWHNAFK